ncbi:glycosyltransferase [Luteibacter sp. SG786]|uniref:dermonecrotic toxin domain-containing protein n=1 Tax=Luteibacter sp. SG786 TaxID=2587130 RepID=UPI0014215FFE|nr:glycosyltransferase [Luteibacter sp. SG786]NII54151.1 hypothetical protein [Luteibacter sp. SG786]
MERIRRTTLATLIAASSFPLASEARPSGEVPEFAGMQTPQPGTSPLARLIPPEPDTVSQAVVAPPGGDLNRLLGEIRHVGLARQPSFSSISKELLAEEVRRHVPALPVETDVEKVYVTTFREAADGRRDIVSSRPLTDIYREIILHPGTFLEFIQSETGFFNAAGTLASSARIPALAGGAGLAKIESALQSARDFRFHFQRRIDRYWNEILSTRNVAGEVEAPTRKTWLARALADLRQVEVDSMVDEGWLEPLGATLMGAGNGVTGIEVLNGNFRNKLSLPPTVAISERPCVNFPEGDCGKLLLLSASLPTRLFENADALRAWLMEAGGQSATLRSQPVSGDPWRWLLDRIVLRGKTDALAAMMMLEASPMAVGEAGAVVDRHGDLTGELDQRWMVDTYNARLRVDLLMPDAIAAASRDEKVAWRTQARRHLQAFRAAGALLAEQPGALRDIKLLARNAMAEALRARGASVFDPDAVSIFHWTFQQHHAGGKPRRWCDEDGVWHKVDEKDTEHTGRKLTLTEAALENLPVYAEPLTQYEVVDVDGQPMRDLPFAAVSAMVREANVAQQYLDTVGRFQSSVNLDAIALGLGHGMMLNLLHAVALPASGLSTHAQTSILHALANAGASTRIAVHHLQVSGASVGGGVLLFHTAGGDKDAWVLYSPGAPDNKAFRSFRGLDEIARKLKDDEALRNYMVEAIVAGERLQASRALARGGRGGEIATVPIAGDFLVAAASAFFAQWRNESRHASNTTSFRDRLTIADNVKGVADVLDVVLPLSGLVGGSLDMNGAIECFLAEEKGCYGKLAAAGLAVALDALPMAAEPFRTPLRSMGKAVRRHFAAVVRGANGRPMVRFALPASASSRLPDSDIAAVLHKFAVSGIEVTSMHSPSRRLFRDGTGQEYVTIGERIYRSRNVLKPDGSGERVIVDPLDAGNTRAIRLSGEGWTVLPAARLVGGSPRRPAITWGEPRWGEGHLKGISGQSTSRRMAVDIDGYRTDILFDLAACKWRAADGAAMRPGAYVEYNDITKEWQYVVLERGSAGAPALPPRLASDEQRLEALNQFGISRAPHPWPRPVEGARTPIPKVINQVWLGDAHALKTRRTRGQSGDLLIDTIEANGRLAKEGGYESRLYVLLDDESPAAVKALQDALPDVKVVDLRSDPLFAEFKTTKYADPFEFFRSPDRSRRNLSAASDILRHFIQYKEGGLYLDTDDALLQGFGQVRLMAKADEVLTGGVMSHPALGMNAEYNTNAFASHKNNGFFIEVLDEQTTRVRLNRHRLSDRPHDRGDRESYDALVSYMPIISQSTGPGVFNDVLRRRSSGHADFADATRDVHVIGDHPWLSNVSSLDGTFERTTAQDGFAPLSKVVDPGNSHSWRQTR